MKKLLLLVTLPLTIAGCSFLNAQYEDGRGNKYTFKSNSVSCFEQYNGIKCRGSAIKKNIGGQRFVVNVKSKWCVDNDNGRISNDTYSMLCLAAQKLGKYNLGSYRSEYEGKKIKRLRLEDTTFTPNETRNFGF